MNIAYFIVSLAIAIAVIVVIVIFREKRKPFDYIERGGLGNGFDDESLGG